MESIQEALEAGANDFVMKPFTVDALKETHLGGLPWLCSRQLDRLALLHAGVLWRPSRRGPALLDGGQARAGRQDAQLPTVESTCPRRAGPGRRSR